MRANWVVLDADKVVEGLLRVAPALSSRSWLGSLNADDGSALVALAHRLVADAVVGGGDLLVLELLESGEGLDEGVLEAAEVADRSALLLRDRYHLVFVLRRLWASRVADAGLLKEALLL